MAIISLTRLTDDDREKFILDNQRSFSFGALEKPGERGRHFENDGEIISRKKTEDRDGAGLPAVFLAFTLITGAFAVFSVF
ncbi:MAG: hypothetical protein K6C08_12940 [Oscillospiraceae bacterium]|nr:hypothetical protein [Oscillospiraceae bacterium]